MTVPCEKGPSGAVEPVDNEVMGEAPQPEVCLQCRCLVVAGRMDDHHEWHQAVWTETSRIWAALRLARGRRPA